MANRIQLNGTSFQVLKAPPAVSKNIRRAMADDRDWFEKHPDAAYRERPAVADEFWPVFDSRSVLYVIVTQVEPGRRLRFPVVHLNRPESERVQ
jgi:hypothetical protein